MRTEKKTGKRDRSRGGELRLKSILVPVDFSRPSRKALEAAVALAAPFGARLTMLHVVEPVLARDYAESFPLSIDDAALRAGVEKEFSQMLAGLKVGRAGSDKVKIKTMLNFGRSHRKIVETARALEVDLIVVGTHGYSGLDRVLLGSTAERVVQHAGCPVLVIR